MGKKFIDLNKDYFNQRLRFNENERKNKEENEILRLKN